jgi:hypothetical protein
LTLLFELAGIVGVSPDNLTLRELLIMSEARQVAEWDRTAAMLCQVANLNRPKNKKAYSLDGFNLFRKAMQTSNKNQVIHDQDGAMKLLRSMAKKERVAK